MTDKNTLKNWFRTGLKPNQEQFWAWMDSFWHKDEKIPITAIDDIENILNAKADAEALQNHINDEVAHGNVNTRKVIQDSTLIQAVNVGGYYPETIISITTIPANYLEQNDVFEYLESIADYCMFYASAIYNTYLTNDINDLTQDPFYSLATGVSSQKKIELKFYLKNGYLGNIINDAVSYQGNLVSSGENLDLTQPIYIVTTGQNTVNGEDVYVNSNFRMLRKIN